MRAPMPSDNAALAGSGAQEDRLIRLSSLSLRPATTREFQTALVFTRGTPPWRVRLHERISQGWASSNQPRKRCGQSRCADVDRHLAGENFEVQSLDDLAGRVADA